MSYASFCGCIGKSFDVCSTSATVTIVRNNNEFCICFSIFAELQHNRSSKRSCYEIVICRGVGSSVGSF